MDYPMETVGLVRPAQTEETAHASLLCAGVPHWALSKRWRLALLALSCAMEAFCYTLCVPFMTTHLHSHLNVSVSLSALVFIAYTTGSVASTPLVEPATRRLGCNGAIVVGLFALGLSQVVFIGLPPIPFLVVARFMGGFAAGLIWSVVLTSCHLMSGDSANMGTLFGTVLSSVSIGTMAGPALGGLLYRFGGWCAPFAVVGLACASVGLVVAMTMPRLDAGRPAHGSHQARSSCQLVLRLPLLLVLGIVMSGAVLFSSIDSILPLHLEQTFHSDALDTSFVFLVVSVFYGLAAPVAGTLADQTGRALLVSMCGLGALAVLLPAFALVPARSLLYPVAALFGAAGTVQLTPASTLLEQIAGTALNEHPTLTYALFNCAYVTGMAVGPGVLATMADHLGFPASAFCLGLGTLTFSTILCCVLHHTSDV